MAEPEGTRSATRVAEILVELAGSQSGLGVAETARRLALPKSVVHRALQSLTASGVLRTATDQRYYAGPVLMALGARAVRESDLREAAIPQLHHLMESTGETAALSLRAGRSRVHIAQVESAREVRMIVSLGIASPLHVGGTGRCILAFMEEHEQEQILASPLVAFTEQTITDAETLRKELEHTRREWVAVSHGERQPDSCVVASPVLDMHDQPVGAISVCGPRSRFEDDKVAEYAALVRESAIEVSRSIGWGTRKGG